MAERDYGLTGLRARAAVVNARSRAVLARTGFTETGQTVLNGLPGITYERDLHPS
jgi:[ribosomal protein S5]-alanine N-acetyltransferase